MFSRPDCSCPVGESSRDVPTVSRCTSPDAHPATAIAMPGVPPGAVKGLKMWIGGQRGGQKTREEACYLEGVLKCAGWGTRGPINGSD